jgi:predicted dehydrogenase
MGNPLAGNAARLPWNHLLVIGNHKSQMPLITRELVNEAIRRVLELPPDDRSGVFLLVASQSPRRREFAEAMCRRLGCGTSVVTFPKFFWFSVATACVWAEKLTGKPFPKGHSRVPQVRYDSSKTEQRIGMKFDFNWEETLQQSVDGQERNFDLPYLPNGTLPEPLTRTRQITILGFGRIVRTKYLPALKRLQFGGELRAYDVLARNGSTGIKVENITGARLQASDLFIVATPGPVHVDALKHLNGNDGAVLVEKPLCYSPHQWAQWTKFAHARRAPVVVCHNYRFKSNVCQMLSVLARFNPGQLNHVEVHFESPSVNNDAAVWMHDERRARTLLMDYGLHFLDLACMFGRGSWRVSGLRHRLDHGGRTALIQGGFTADNYSVSFLLRQGFGPRRAHVVFNFQNYSVNLGFFPDTCTVCMADDNPWLHLQEGLAAARATFRKIRDKLGGSDSDLSHAVVIAAAANGNPPQSQCIAVESLSDFYALMFELSEQIYGKTVR